MTHDPLVWTYVGGLYFHIGSLCGLWADVGFMLVAYVGHCAYVSWLCCRCRRTSHTLIFFRWASPRGPPPKINTINLSVLAERLKMDVPWMVTLPHYLIAYFFVTLRGAQVRGVRGGGAPPSG